MHTNLQDLIRPNILSVLADIQEPCAAEDMLRFDRNENAFNVPGNRYPLNGQAEIGKTLSNIYGIREDCIALQHGIKESLDLLLRIFCIPQRDNVVSIAPSRGIIETLTAINDVEIKHVWLDEKFNTTAQQVLQACNRRTKLIYLCSPNSPTGNIISRSETSRLIASFPGIVVVDESYIGFSTQPSLLPLIAQHPNLIVLGSFSNFWAAASLSLSYTFSIPTLARIIRQIGGPYTVNTPTQKEACKILARRFDVEKWANIIREERGRVMASFKMLPFCQQVYHSEANFFLARVTNAASVAAYLQEQGIMVRQFPKTPALANHLRIRVSLPADNSRLLGALRKYKP